MSASGPSGPLVTCVALAKAGLAMGPVRPSVRATDMDLGAFLVVWR